MMIISHVEQSMPFNIQNIGVEDNTRNADSRSHDRGDGSKKMRKKALMQPHRHIS